MTQEQFDIILKDRLNDITLDKILHEKKNFIEKLLSMKKADYVMDNTDVLRNFKMGSKLQNITSQECLRGYLTKHIISIYDLIDDFSNGKKIDKNRLQEKISDSIAYHILLEALFIEEEFQIGETKNG